MSGGKLAKRDVNFRKIGKVPNDHPNYVMWSTKKIKNKTFMEIKHLLLLKTKNRLGNHKASSNYDVRGVRRGRQARI